MNKFRESDKVVCVYDAFDQDQLQNYSSLPKKGVVYVVRGIDPRGASFGPLGRTRYCLLLVGIQGIDDGFGEWGFHPQRFRRLDDIKAENAQTLRIGESHR